jgi:hypothetical protein
MCAGYLSSTAQQTLGARSQRGVIMVVFNGTIKVKVVEAKDLSPTETSIRLYSVVGQANKSPQLDAYVNVDLDEIMIGQTKTIAKCVTPLWNEEFSSEVRLTTRLGITQLMLRMYSGAQWQEHRIHGLSRLCHTAR